MTRSPVTPAASNRTGPETGRLSMPDSPQRPVQDPVRTTAALTDFTQPMSTSYDTGSRYDTGFPQRAPARASRAEPPISCAHGGARLFGQRRNELRRGHLPRL